MLKYVQAEQTAKKYILGVKMPYLQIFTAGGETPPLHLINPILPQNRVFYFLFSVKKNNATYYKKAAKLPLR
jgi:hypothetical protein